MINVFGDFIEQFNIAQYYLGRITNALAAFQYLTAYNYMLILIDKEARDHPEAQKYPEMVDLLLKHFLENYREHINIGTGSIVNESVAGSFQDLLDWQEAGYSIVRNEKNYTYRLKKWSEIFNGASVQKNTTRDKEGKFRPGTQGTLVDSSTGQPVTYKTIIMARTANYDASKVPFWYPFNYGSIDLGGRAGYPAAAGLNFLEKAESELPVIGRLLEPIIEQYGMRLFESASNLHINGFDIDGELKILLRRLSQQGGGKGGLRTRKYLRKKMFSAIGLRIEDLAFSIS